MLTPGLLPIPQTLWMPLLLGPLAPGTQLGTAKQILRPAETNSLSIGDLINIWDVFFVWDSHCIPERDLVRWRLNGDDLADDALDELFADGDASHGLDLLAAVERAASSSPACTRFLSGVAQDPPPGIAASASDFLAAHRFFWENSAAILQSLLHMSLAGGFSSPRITRVLRATSYLIPSHVSKDDMTEEAQQRTFVRLLETLQFVLDVMGGIHPDAPYPSPSPDYVSVMSPKQPGWTSAIRVRLLHALARRRSRSRALPGEVPLNQQDMLSSLASFSVAPIWALIRMSPRGLEPSTSEREAFIAVWRHIGWYLGISPDLLRAHFSCYDAAAKLLATAELTSLLPEEDDSTFVPPTMPLLRAIAGRPPLRSSLEFHCALSRFMLGAPLADHLLIPRSSLTSLLGLAVGLVAIQVPKWFGDVWRPGWREKRSLVFRHALPKMVRYHLGMRRTMFRPRESAKWAFSDDVRSMESTGPRDEVGGARLQRDWLWLMCEMGIVTMSAGGAVLYSLVNISRLLLY